MTPIERVAAAVALAVSAALCAAQPVTTESLIREMTDMARLAEFPDPAYKTVQFSSFDRRSTLPGEPGWFSNADGFGNEPIPAFEEVLREPGEDGVGEYLICDVQSPGAVVRCWTAAINGQIRMELDGRVVFDGSADDFLRRPFNVLGGSVGIDPAVFDGSFNQQNAAYCPMPFAKRCRIVWTGNLKQVHFYEVQVRVYEPGAEVKTFEAADLRNAIGTLRRTAAALVTPGDRLGATGKATPIEAAASPGQEVELLSIEEGPGAIAQLSLRVAAGDPDRALRQTVLQISFDGAQEPQVQCPVGDFFGAAPGINPFDSVPFTVDLDGTMTCRFVMPFASSARVTALNLGDQEVKLTGSVARSTWDWDNELSMHFRARWRVDHGLIGDPQRPQDIPFLVAHGAGRYVGTASIMLNPTDVPTPAGGWWGEGDEKIFVDDDTSPSTYGTGSEDYYNYAWSIPDIFGFAYCGQPRNDGPGNRGFVTNHRWHVIDDLPFRDSIAFYMELWPHMRVPGFSYARLSYHYARPELADDHTRITPEDVRLLDLPAWTARPAWGSQGAVFTEAEGVLGGGSAAVGAVKGNLFSGGRAAMWRPTAAGDEVSMGFDVGEAGRYAVDLCALLTGDSGRIRLWIDDREEDAVEIDLTSPGRRILRRVGMGDRELTAGEHTLHMGFLGGSGRTVGIDFLWVQKR